MDLTAAKLHMGNSKLELNLPWDVVRLLAAVRAPRGGARDLPPLPPLPFSSPLLETAL